MKIPETTHNDIILRANAAKSRDVLQVVFDDVCRLPDCPGKRLLKRYLKEVANSHGWYAALREPKKSA